MTDYENENDESWGFYVELENLENPQIKEVDNNYNNHNHKKINYKFIVFNFALNCLLFYLLFRLCI